MDTGTAVPDGMRVCNEVSDFQAVASAAVLASRKLRDD
jgi:hypothetical protein